MKFKVTFSADFGQDDQILDTIESGRHSDDGLDAQGILGATHAGIQPTNHQRDTEESAASIMEGLMKSRLSILQTLDSKASIEGGASIVLNVDAYEVQRGRTKIQSLFQPGEISRIVPVQ